MADSSDTLVPELPVPNNEDFKRLTDHFLNKFNSQPEYYVKVPGRVNLIGEHIDYSGYSVCPMALHQSIVAAIRVVDEKNIQLTNVQESFEDFTCSIDFKIEVNGAPKWYQYFLCGVQGVLEKIIDGEVKGLQVAILGNVPPNSGLSSSSALVSAAILASARAYDLPLNKLALAELAARSERYIGTQGGGMDQAIAFLASEDSAKIISFNPLNCEELPLPAGAVFVIASSLVQMNKAATTDFNQRVIETRIAAFLLAHRLNFANWLDYPTVKHIQKKLSLGVRHFRALVMETLHDHPYTKKELSFEFKIPVEKFEATVLTDKTRHLEEFKLKQRLMHVVKEVERVQEFVRLCKAHVAGNESEDGCLWKLGQLMRNSHESCRVLYECSHKELEKIIAIADKRTLGTRLTGAGWGGCTVALLKEDQVDAYIEALKEEFYSSNPAAIDRDLNELVFRTKPSAGAAVYVN